jgi:hypothetical protein
MIISFSLVLLSKTYSQKNYVSLEAGAFFGNANSNIGDGMNASGFGDNPTFDFFGLIFTTDYPVKSIDGSAYRLRAGRHIKKNIAVEGGFGRSYNGLVKGYDEGSNYQANSLSLMSSINSIYFAFVFSDSSHRVGIGIGPAVSLYTLQTLKNNEAASKSSRVLPGVYITSYINIVNKKKWFVGFRSDLSITAPYKIEPIVLKNSTSTFESRFKGTNAGSFTGVITMTAGLRFN